MQYTISANSDEDEVGGVLLGASSFYILFHSKNLTLERFHHNIQLGQTSFGMQYIISATKA